MPNSLPAAGPSRTQGQADHPPIGDPGPRPADGPRESTLGLQTDPERVARTRPFRGRLDRLEDLEGSGARSRTPTVRSDLATVPVRPGPRDPRSRLPPRRYRVPAPSLRPRRRRTRPPPR